MFVESPTYHLGLRILGDHHLDLRPIPTDADGLRVDLLAEQLQRLASNGQRARLLYTIPTFHNPTGVSLSSARRRALVDLAVEHGFVILEDDVYRELSYDGAAPPALFGLAPRGTVIRMGSFAKSLAPGLRLGWINCSAAIRRDGSRMADSATAAARRTSPPRWWWPRSAAPATSTRTASACAPPIGSGGMRWPRH